MSVDKLKTLIFNSRSEMGRAAGSDTIALIKALLDKKSEVNIIFAAAPSQEEFLCELVNAKDVEWNRVNAYHMDEYIGLPAGSPQSFGEFLRIRIFDKLKFKTVNYLDGTAKNIIAECERYASLLEKNPPDIVCMGIGENGHIAFNDPHVALFNDPKRIKIVKLDKACRCQQVNDGCFKALEAVPKNAITLTIPALLSAEYIICVVPGKRKADAVRATVKGRISEKCPASILRTHERAVLYCDLASGEFIL